MSIGKILTDRGYGMYTSKLEKEVMSRPIPNHIAVIMDGNRRYAEERGKTTKEGHVDGRDKLEEMLDWCLQVDVKVLTVFAFSTDNFTRSDDEVDFIMELMETTLVKFADDDRIHENRVALRVIGDRSIMPESVLKAVDYAGERTKDYSDYYLNVAIAYGGREEIVRAVKEIAMKVKEGDMDIADITEDSISDNLYTYDLPDPDLVLRTSGEQRVSNFLLWQLAYSEFYFCDIFWPGFRYIDFLRAIRSFQQRSRRFGQ